MADEQVEIAASKLGTKDYWDGRYEMELTNFEENGDEGEVWFGKSAENRIIKYLLESKTSREARILDLGCGNGSVLRRLREKGFTALTGVDYSPAAISLSRKADEQEREEDGGELEEIEWKVLDITNPTGLCHQYDVVLDKGTWDAMSLTEGEQREQRRAAYKSALLLALNEQKTGVFVIVSCNFTKEELNSLFGGDGLELVGEIPAGHSISFGGKQGVTSTGVVFKAV